MAGVFEDLSNFALSQRLTSFKPEDIHLREEACDNRQQVFLVTKENYLSLFR